MMTIQDCLGQRLLCYAIDNDDSTIRVYPQFIIKDKLIEIQEGDRMRLFSSDGSFLLKKNRSYAGHPYIEARNLRYESSPASGLTAKFIPYQFEECAFCLVLSELYADEVLSRGTIDCDTSLLPQISNSIYLHCKSEIVGPFSYKITGKNSIVLSGESANNDIISRYDSLSLKTKKVFTGAYGFVELIRQVQISTRVPKLKYQYKSEDNGDKLMQLFRRFDLIKADEQHIDVSKLEHRLYVIDQQLYSLKRILDGAINPHEAAFSMTAVMSKDDTISKKLETERLQLQEDIRRLRSELDKLQQEQADKNAAVTQKESELKELEMRVCNSINTRIAVLQEKIAEYKTVAGGVAAQVDKKLLDTIQKLVSSVSIEGTEQLTLERAENVEATAMPELPTLPMLSFRQQYQKGELGQEIIKRVQGYLAAKNRFCSAAVVANYLVCLTQGFMTTFAGNPGSGKTSLCNLLAKALGLVAAHDGTHFVDVPVCRGWTSAKDFIGYHNPLTKEMVPSNAAVYKALKLSEKEDSREVPPMVILLDEANLSPLEHYWSSFLKNSDFSSSAARTFSLGGDKVWAIGPHLRFLATVNHDHTTEELSPRFLDRSWVILLDGQSSEVDARDINIPDISGEWAAIPYAKLEEAFGVTAHAKLTMKPEVLQLWTAIRAAMQESQMRIMPRNVNMVENYVKTASLYMSDTFAPLDYAMAQKILPTLSGSGERMKDCLTQLHRLCDGKLPRTASLLARMLEAGKHNMEMYQFFVS